MSIKLHEEAEGKILIADASDKLAKKDYEELVPMTQRSIKRHGKIRILFAMRSFHGWKLAAAWENLKFDLKRFKDVERPAFVGEKTWEQWMASFCRPFTRAEMRYFDLSERTNARQWLHAGLHQGTA